jgi:hypothetical protein
MLSVGTDLIWIVFMRVRDYFCVFLSYNVAVFKLCHGYCCWSCCLLVGALLTLLINFKCPGFTLFELLMLQIVDSTLLLMVCITSAHLLPKKKMQFPAILLPCKLLLAFCFTALDVLFCLILRLLVFCWLSFGLMVYAVTTASLFRNLSHSRLLAFQLFV